jgi:hypothetical protein
MMMKKAMFLMAAISVITVSFSGCIGTTMPSEKMVSANGTEGVSWKPVVPVKSAALVGYDPNSYADDYAYCAAVPSSTFYSKVNDKVYSYPVVYYTPEKELEDAEKTLNPGQGVRYFMEDWNTYADNKLDRAQIINVPAGELTGAKALCNASKVSVIPKSDPYTMAKDIALSNWQYSDTAVVAVVAEKYADSKLKFSGKVNGSMPGSYTLKTDKITGQKEVGITPIYHNFTVEEPTKYVQAHMTWHGFVQQLDPYLQRGKDPDLTLYDWQLGECSASSNWNVLSGPYEDCGSYVYHTGNWGYAVTYMPTKSLDDVDDGQAGPLNSLSDFLPPALTTAKYEIDTTYFPGVEVPIKDKVPYFARDIEFELSWSGDAKLGLAILGPEGAEIAYEATGTSPQQVYVSEMGEGNYKLGIIKIADSSTDTPFQVTYSWKQNMTRTAGDCLASAANGAVIGSLHNAPLLYASLDGVPGATYDALDMLGVTKVYLVNLGGHGGDKIAQDISGHRSMLQPRITVTQYKDYKPLYKSIIDLTKTNDVVFSTVDPWSYWNVGGKGPAGEEPKGLFIGPAALAAAHHGTPVLIVDNHQNLSCPKAWYDVCWLKAYPGRSPPSVSCMILTGHEIYGFLKDIGLDKEGSETILTVADQFDIGTPWDRALVGAANSGRIMGSPVDASYWICRAALYQAVIFSNPATDPAGVDMVTGTESNIDPGPQKPGIAPIEPVPVNAKYPVLQTWVSYQHRFNERASTYWGTNYVSASGITPYWSPSDNSIDEGVNAKYGQTGAYWPDITTSEVVPFYVEKAGYSSVYSTNFDDTMNNLNAGTIMWLEVMHGGNRADGIVGFWDDSATHNEKCPWRGYEFTGCTREPDTFRMSKEIGLDVVRSVSDRDRDGVIIAIVNQQGTVTKGGLEFDKALTNVHSMGFNGGSCLIANTYLHLTMVRHGSVFQVIDPWLTSWYASFAMATFARGIALGYDIGSCYAEGIKHVGIGYLTDQWWWDIYENVIYYGDPNLRAWSPTKGWDKPIALKAGVSVNGHSPTGATSHPAAIGSTMAFEGLLYASIAGFVVLGVIMWKKKMSPKDLIRKLRRKQ